MEINGFSQEVSSIVSTNVKSSETETPYQSGDHCEFYAFQEAALHFKGISISKNTRTEMQQEKEYLTRIVLKHFDIKGAGEAGSLAIILPRLQAIGIQPKQLTTLESKADIIIETMKECGVNFTEAPNIVKSEAEITVKLPALIVQTTPESNAGHIWFCKDKTAFQTEMTRPKHTKTIKDKTVYVSL